MRARSILFVPLYNPKILVSAAFRKAAAESDAILLDLEDSLPPAMKREGRELLPKAAKHFSSLNQHVWVRVNTNDALLREDLAAIFSCGLRHVVMPKTETLAQMKRFADHVRALPGGAECETGLGFESPLGVMNSREIMLSTERLFAVFFGPEDYSADLGVAPRLAGLFYPASKVVMEASALGLPAYGYAGPFNEYKKLLRFRRAASLAKSIGFSGGYAIHPRQVSVLNEVFCMSESEARYAEACLESAEKRNRAVFTEADSMIGPPMLKRFRKLLARKRDNKR